MHFGLLMNDVSATDLVPVDFCHTSKSTSQGPGVLFYLHYISDNCLICLNQLLNSVTTLCQKFHIALTALCVCPISVLYLIALLCIALRVKQDLVDILEFFDTQAWERNLFRQSSRRPQLSIRNDSSATEALPEKLVTHVVIVRYLCHAQSYFFL